MITYSFIYKNQFHFGENSYAIYSPHFPKRKISKGIALYFNEKELPICKVDYFYIERVRFKLILN